jgi:hypothetical protein
MDTVLKVVFPALAAVFLVLYLMRRKSRLKAED